MEVIEGEAGKEKPKKGNRLLKGMNSAEIAGLIVGAAIAVVVLGVVIILGLGLWKYLGDRVL